MSVIVVGGTRGIGLAISKKFSGLGHAVTMAYRSNDQAAAAAVEQLPGSSQAVCADVTEKDGVIALYDAAEKMGPVKFIVHSAVVPTLGNALTAELEEFDLAYRTGPRAFLILVQEAAKRMKDGGHIVAIGSIASAPRYVQGYGILGPAKSAIDHLVCQLGGELASRDIRINCIATGTVESKFTKEHPRAEKMLDVITKKTPAGRIGQESDVADAVAMICSRDAHWVVGQTIIADGGIASVL